MTKKEIVCFVLMFIGTAIMAVSYLDIISIISSVLNKLLNLGLPDVWFNSFVFRGIIVLFGGLVLIAGGLLLKNNRKQSSNK